ncbi:MAG: hypothetical protein SVK08_00100 [Halobacteriota archaeon]|nr:hypothetical protein [Halobacteriota archaeon]
MKENLSEYLEAYKEDCQGLPVYFTILNDMGDMCHIAQMSYMWELATEKDLLVRVSHPLREVWIVELDRVYTVPKSALSRRNVEAIDIDDEDRMLALSGNLPPVKKRGTGSFLPVKSEFKKIELRRSAFFLNELLMFIDRH